MLGESKPDLDIDEVVPSLPPELLRLGQARVPSLVQMPGEHYQATIVL